MALSTSPRNSIVQPGVCTSATRPSSPYEGQTIYETDTDRIRTWDGTNWAIISAPALPWSLANGAASDMINAIGSFAGATNWGTTAIAGGRVKVERGNCTAKMRITASGSGISTGTAGEVGLILPAPAVAIGNNPPIGHGFYLNAATTVFVPFIIVADTTAQAKFYFPSTHNGQIVSLPTTTAIIASGASIGVFLDYDTSAT